MAGSKAIVAYIPVLHDGYRRFLEKHHQADVCFIFGSKLIDEFDYLHKEIRALDPDLMCSAIRSLGILQRVEVLDSTYTIKADTIFMPDEDVSRRYAEDRLGDRSVVFDPVFLRWDRQNTQKKKKVGPDMVITKDQFMNLAFKEAMKSSDWWRQVGAVLVKDGQVVGQKFNQHLPSLHQPYADGDPRNASKKGQDLDKFTSIHAEAALIAEAARTGVSIQDSEIYVTDFPCPVCAKQIAMSGIKKLYFTRGYDALDGQRVLHHAGIDMIKIETASETFD